MPTESFWRRHFRPPSAFGIIVILLVAAVVAGFLSAVVWSANDTEQALGPEAPPPSLATADEAEAPPATTTTRPDLSLEGIDRKIRPLAWSVATFDAAGQPSAGSAFAAGTTEGQTLLLTSLAVVEAGTRAPGPEIIVKNGSYSGPATLWTWDESRDLALLVVPRSNSPSIPWDDDNPPPKIGDQAFAVAFDRVGPGLVTGVSGAAVQHNIFVDDAMRGGALVNIKGEVLGILSAAYTAGGQPTDTTFFGVPIRATCAKVLSCPGVPSESAEAPASGGGSSTSTTSTTRRRS